MGIFKKKNKVNQIRQEIQENTEVDYRKNKIRYVQILSFFAESVLNQEKEEKFGLVYLRTIDKNLKDPKERVEASLFLYDCLLFLVEQTELFVSMSIPLTYLDKPTNIEDLNYAYLIGNYNMDESETVTFYLSSSRNPDECVVIENLSKELQKNVTYKEIWDKEVGYVRIIDVNNLVRFFLE